MRDPRRLVEMPDGRLLPAFMVRAELRWRLVAAFKAQCEYCGFQGDHPESGWSIDRIVPGCAGGDYVPGNITLACLRCNLRKSSHDFIGPVRSLETMERAHGG